MASCLTIVLVMKTTPTLAFLLMSILAGLAKTEQWEQNIESQAAEDASPGLSTFLEHVLKVQDEINWVKKISQHEKAASKEQCRQCKSQPFTSSDNFEMLDSDSDYNLYKPAQNLEENEWGLGTGGDNFAPVFPYDSNQNQFKSKNIGERFKRKLSDTFYKEPELKEIVRNNINNLHMLKLSPAQDTNIHMIAETSDSNNEDNTSVERRGTGQADSKEEANMENGGQKEDPSDSVPEAYFAAHGKRQASRGQSISSAHSRGVRVDIPDLLSEADLLKTMSERSEQEHQRLQLEDADGLLKGTRVDSHIGSIDNQMALDRGKLIKQTTKGRLETVPIQERKITSRDSQSQDHGLPQQIKLDLLMDPLYNKVDLKSVSRNVNVRNDNGEKSLIRPLGVGGATFDNHLLSSVDQYLAGFDQKSQESPNREEPELARAQIFLNKKDTIGQQVKWDESGVTPQPLWSAQVLQNIADKDADSSAVHGTDLNVVSKDAIPSRLTRSNQENSGDSSHPASEHSVSEIQNQFVLNNQGRLQSSRDKRTVVKRPGAIWHESTGNEDLEEETGSENEDKEVISFESDESDADEKVSRNSNGVLSKSSSDDDHSSVSDAKEKTEEANDEKFGNEQFETNIGGLDQKHGSDNIHLDDAAHLKASYEFSSKYAPVPETNSILEENDKTNSLDNHLVRNKRSIKITRQGINTGKLSKKEEKGDVLGMTSSSGAYHEHDNHLDDATRLKDSFKFSSKFDPPLDTNRVQQSEGIHKSFAQESFRPMRDGQDVKKSLHSTEAFGGSQDRNKCERKSGEVKLEVSSDNVLEESNISNMLSKQVENPSLTGKSHSSRSLLCLFEPSNVKHNLENERGLSPTQNFFNSKNQSNEIQEEGKYLAEPLSAIIDRELHSGNLPPLIRVKRSEIDAEKTCNNLVTETIGKKQAELDAVNHSDNDWKSFHVTGERSAFDKQSEFILDPIRTKDERPSYHPGADSMAILIGNQAIDDVQLNSLDSRYQRPALKSKRQSGDDTYLHDELSGNADVDPGSIFENVCSSSCSARIKRAHGHVKRNHGRGKGPTARDAGGNGTEQLSRNMKSEWKINIRPIKRAHRIDEDEDEKEYESASLNIFSANVTKRATGQTALRDINFGADKASDMRAVSINLPINVMVDETEDENEYDSSQVEKEKDYDVVRRHVQHRFHKRHPDNKDFVQASTLNVGNNGFNGESRIKNGLTKQVVKYKEQEEDKEGKPNEMLSEERFKRASNYDGLDTGKVKSEMLEMPGVNNDMGNIKPIKNNPSQFLSDLKSQYESDNKLQNHAANLNPPVKPDSSMISQLSPGSIKGGSKEKAVQDSSLSGSDLHEIHEIQLAGTKLSDSSAYGNDVRTNMPYSNKNYEDTKLQAPTANEQAPVLHGRSAEKCNVSPVNRDARGVPSTSLSCPTKRPNPGSQLRTERWVDSRRHTDTATNTPEHKNSGVSSASEYKGELDDGQLTTDIVQAIFQQVDKTPCLKKSFSSGLSLRYHPSEIKETKEFNSHSQQMMHQIMQLIDQSVDEEVKSRTCSSLPSDLEEFIMWLMKNETHPLSSTENPFLFESHCEKAPAPRHLEEPKAEDIERQISLRNKLICEYNKLDKCDQDEAKPIYNYLMDQKTFLTTLLENSKSKSGCYKRMEGSKNPGYDSELEQQRLVDETMDSVGLGPNAMHSSNIGDKFISGMSMVDESGERMGKADGASVARRSVPEDSQMGSQKSLYGKSQFHDSRSESEYSHRIQRDAEDESLGRRSSRNDDDDEMYDDYGAAGYEDGDANYDAEAADNFELKRSFKNPNHCKDKGNKRRSIKKSDFYPSQKYKRLVALASKLKRKKRNAFKRRKQMVK